MMLTPGSERDSMCSMPLRQREESLEAAGDVVFDLLRRHARIEGRDDDDGDVDRGEHSTGMRARDVPPSTQITRAQTMMK